MIGSANSSAPEPVRTMRPISMTKARWQRSSAMVTSCSTSRIEVPFAFSARSAADQLLNQQGRQAKRQFVDHSSSGALIRPRPIAHICCSPPDKRRCRLPAALAQLRKCRVDLIEVALQLGAGHLSRVGAHQQILFDAHGAEQSASLGHMHDAVSQDFGGAVAGEVPSFGEIIAARASGSGRTARASRWSCRRRWSRSAR